MKSTHSCNRPSVTRAWTYNKMAEDIRLSSRQGRNENQHWKMDWNGLLLPRLFNVHNPQ